MSTQDGPRTTSDPDFLMEEYRQLRLQVSQILERKDRFERICFGALIVVFGFMFGDSFLIDAVFEVWLWCLPPLISLVAMRRAYFYHQRLVDVTLYIRDRIEPEFLPPNRGWENYVSDLRQAQGWRFWNSYGIARLWVLIFFATAVLAVVKAYGVF